MATKVLITGASGYIGGSLLKHLLASPTAKDVKIFALVRSDSQVAEVQRMEGVTPLRADLSDEKAISAAVVDHQITIVIETVDAVSFAPAKAFIEGLAAVGKSTGASTHFFHTSGAKLVSSHTGIPGDETLSDSSAVYELQKTQISPFPPMNPVIAVNTDIIDFAGANNVKSYIIVPPMVYGPGEGFGNKTSIQILALFQIVQATRKVFQVDATETSWMLCHLRDLTSLYITILQAIITKQDPPAGKKGFYFAENGQFKWNDLSKGIAANLKVDQSVVPATPADLEEMGKILCCPAAFVPVSVAGSCNLRGDNGRALGWKPEYDLQHLMSEKGVGDDTLLMVREMERKAAL
ncbi:hypothetical protein P7C70_g540, partial [Phenoliferia sp. Uapishka_3]